MTIKVIYNSKDFFGQYDFREETKEAASVDDLKKALRAMKKDRDFAVHVDGRSIVWDSYADYENDVVKVRTYKAWNSYDETKMSWDKMKKYILREVTK